MMSSWLLLFFAIVTEVSGTTCMKLSKGFTELWPTILVFVFYGFSFTASTFALKTIDLSIAYAVWMGLGTAIIVVIGMIWFKESLSAEGGGKLRRVAVEKCGTGWMISLSYFCLSRSSSFQVCGCMWLGVREARFLACLSL